MKRAPGSSDRAFVLRVSPYGEADAVVQLMTERSGALAAIAKRARASSHKRTWVLEPFHTLTVEVSPGSGELAYLRSATIATARTSLLDDSARLDAAGLATRWTRALSPSRVPEPAVFLALEWVLDAIAASIDPSAATSAFGLRLLDALGYGLELAGCARCARARPEGRPGYVSGVGGGVLCESCRRGVAINAPLLSGALLDQLAVDAMAVIPAWAGATLDERAALARIVREAIEGRAHAVGARLSP